MASKFDFNVFNSHILATYIRRLAWAQQTNENVIVETERIV